MLARENSGTTANGWTRPGPPSYKEQLRGIIDGALADRPADFAGFLRRMEAAGVQVKRGRGGAKLPKMDALKKECRELSERKKKLYAQYRAAQQEMREAVAVKANPFSRSTISLILRNPIYAMADLDIYFPCNFLPENPRNRRCPTRVRPI